MFYGVLNEGIRDIFKKKDNKNKKRSQHQPKPRRHYNKKLIYEHEKSWINDIIAASKGEKFLGEDPRDVYEAYYIADKIGLATPTELDKAQTQFCSKNIDDPKDEGILEYFYGERNWKDVLSKAHFNSEEAEELAKMIPGLKENIHVCTLYVIDDTIVFFNPKNKNFYFCYDYCPEACYYDSSLYTVATKLGGKDSFNFTAKDIEFYKEIYESIIGSTLNEGFFGGKTKKFKYYKTGVKIVNTEVEILTANDDADKFKDIIKSDAAIINKKDSEIYEKSIEVLTKAMKKYVKGFAESNTEIVKKDVLFKKCIYNAAYHEYVLTVEYKDMKDFGYAEIMTEVIIKVNNGEVSISTKITEY